VKDSLYFRLRGSNQGLNVNNETDRAGNPLPDSLMGANTAAKAFADLWFYSNPVFVANHSRSSSVETHLNDNGNIQIYPNPASDQLTISVSEESRIRIFDAKGAQVVKETVIHANQNQVINITDLTNGVYFVKISNDRYVKMQKVVVNK
jgi:hypothetical protein